jgi:hypothetical protein
MAMFGEAGLRLRGFADGATALVGTRVRPVLADILRGHAADDGQSGEAGGAPVGSTVLHGNLLVTRLPKMAVPNIFLPKPSTREALVRTPERNHH